MQDHLGAAGCRKAYRIYNVAGLLCHGLSSSASSFEVGTRLCACTGTGTGTGVPVLRLWLGHRGCVLSTLHLHVLLPPPVRSHLDRLSQLVSGGQLAVVLDPHRFVGLSAVPEAVDLLQSGASSGKVVVQLASDLPAAPGAPAKL